MTTEIAGSLLTGDADLGSLRDGREVWIDGGRVDDVTSHPAFRNQQLGGAPLVIPSSAEDLRSPELRPVLDRYYRGSSGDAHERIKLFKLIWDAMGSEFAGRHAGTRSTTTPRPSPRCACGCPPAD